MSIDSKITKLFKTVQNMKKELVEDVRKAYIRNYILERLDRSMRYGLSLNKGDVHKAKKETEVRLAEIARSNLKSLTWFINEHGNIHIITLMSAGSAYRISSTCGVIPKYCFAETEFNKRKQAIYSKVIKEYNNRDKIERERKLAEIHRLKHELNID